MEENCAAAAALGFETVCLFQAEHIRAELESRDIRLD
jgi:hypothetical protein